MSRLAAGIDLGGTSIKAGLVEEKDGLIFETSFDTGADNGPEHVLGQLAKAVKAVEAQGQGEEVLGVGIGAPGSINLDRTTITRPPNFLGWGNVNISLELNRHHGITAPILIENDANAAALGSCFYGAGTEHDSFIMVTLGTGVGGAIIVNNTLFRGTSGGAGEIGHMTIDYEGPFDRAGVAGAIEAYVGQRFLSRHARYQLMTLDRSIIHDRAGRDLLDITPHMLYEAAKDGDTAAADVLAWAGHKLGCVLGSAVNLLDIRTIIVGGGLSGAGDLILEPARHAIKRFVTPAFRENILIKEETLGNDAGMLGAARLVFEHLDEASPNRT
ncbi:MAG: ROK family protein [Rhodothermales bacterium]|nr:ROK family protein [Rhodothermales bacterium]